MSSGRFRTRLARLEAQVRPDRLESVWLYYTDRPRSTYRIWRGQGIGHLYIGRDLPHPVPPGTAVFGLRPGRPYPDLAARAIRPGPAESMRRPRKTILTADQVDAVLAAVTEDLPAHAAGLVRAAGSVVIIGVTGEQALP
jgi:hypothetical protein